MRCAIPQCHGPIVVTEPVPLCGADAARVVVAYGQAHLADPVPPAAPPAEPAPVHPQMPEQQALGVIAAAADTVSIRDLATLTGWSIGWVHARRAEKREQGTEVGR